jgi:Ca2+-binding EF-hand superfamily protein
MKRGETKAALTLCCALIMSCLDGPLAIAEVATDEELKAAFMEADLNGDGVIDFDEYGAYMVNLFAVVDTDRDGYLMPEDLPDVTAEEFAAIDRNGDGRISLGEAVGEKVIEFFDIDTNGDGVISLDELIAFEHRPSN